MFKKVLTITLALAILMIPATSFAASKAKQGNIDYYAGKIDSNYDAYDHELTKVNKVNVGMTKVTTTNAKLLAKLTGLQDDMNGYMTAALKGIDEAKVLLGDLKIGDSKSEMKALKTKIRTISKNIKKADTTRKNLKHRLENLRITI